MDNATKQWTLAEVHALPDDGNHYELIRGELFITPPPTWGHETILSRLNEILISYVRTHALGHVYSGKSVVRHEGSEVGPDLLVRQAPPRSDSPWEDAPPPLLVVEIHSPSTQRRDQREKRSLYIEAGVDEYWMVDDKKRTITVVRSARDDVVVYERITWSPTGASSPLSFHTVSVFG